MSRFAPLALVSLLVVGCQRAPTEEVWVDGETTPSLTGTSVTAGAPLSLHDLRGNVVLLAFGYTSCTDICPVTLGRLQGTLRELGADASRVTPLYASVDPHRDTPERFKSFLSVFDPRIVGLSIPDERLPGILDAFDVVAEKQPPPVSRYVAGGEVDPEKDYAIDHTTSILVLDPEGRVRIRYSMRATPTAIAKGVRTLLREGAR